MEAWRREATVHRVSSPSSPDRRAWLARSLKIDTYWTVSMSWSASMAAKAMVKLGRNRSCAVAVVIVVSFAEFPATKRAISQPSQRLPR